MFVLCRVWLNVETLIHTSGTSMRGGVTVKNRISHREKENNILALVNLKITIVYQCLK